HQPESLFAFPESLLCLLELGDVLNHVGESGSPLWCHSYVADHSFQVPVAIAAMMNVLEAHRPAAMSAFLVVADPLLHNVPGNAQFSGKLIGHGFLIPPKKGR